MEIERWPTPEESSAKCRAWLEDAQSALDESSPIVGIEPEDVRFLMRLERGIELSDHRQQLISRLLDRRSAFLEDSGVDIILEQYFILKELIDRPK